MGGEGGGGGRPRRRNKLVVASAENSLKGSRAAPKQSALQNYDSSSIGLAARTSNPEFAQFFLQTLAMQADRRRGARYVPAMTHKLLRQIRDLEFVLSPRENRFRRGRHRCHRRPACRQALRRRRLLPANRPRRSRRRDKARGCVQAHFSARAHCRASRSARSRPTLRG